jgi:hypothetical protein
MTKQYMTAFPDFDNGDTFDTLLAALEPMGFFDSSYKNDVSPSIMLPNKYDLSAITVWVDYKDRALREWPETITDIFVEITYAEDQYLESINREHREDDADGVSNDTNKDFTSVADALTYVRMHYMELELEND